MQISKKYLDNSTAQTIATYISSHRKAIANSVKKHMTAPQAGVTSVVQWIRGWSNNDDIIPTCLKITGLSGTSPEVLLGQ
jgi:predicted alpha/beta-fold hydrolase